MTPLVALWATLAVAGPEDALDPGVRPFWLRAEEEAAAGRPARAIPYLEIVLTRDPAFLPASLALGGALAATGDLAAAEGVYRALPYDADATEALARLLEARDPTAAAEAWARLESLRFGDPTPFGARARLLAATAPDDALDAWARYRLLLQAQPPDPAVARALATGLEAAARPEAAELVWREALEAHPDGPIMEEARAALDRFDVQRAAAARILSAAEPLPPRLGARLAAGVRALGHGRADEALAIGAELVAAAPRAAEGHALLADAAIAAQEWGAAETHARLARTLAPDDAAARLRLARVLSVAYGGRRDLEALAELRAAADLRPDDARVRYELGRLEQAVGEWEAAAASFSSFLQANPTEGPARSDAAARLDALRRAPPPPPELPPSPRSDLPPDAEAHYRTALTLLDRGRQEEGTTALDAALRAAPDAVDLLNLRARLARRQGQPEAAAALYARSLAVHPEQGSVLVELGDLAEADGDAPAANDAYRRAASLGSADGHYKLARSAAERGDWAAVRRELAAFEEAGGAVTGIWREEARALSGRAWTRFVAGWSAAGVGALVALGAPAAWWARRRSARTLRELLDRHPEAWQEAARVLAGLRHEVLKHNTTVLPDVADALARGDRGPWDAFARSSRDIFDRFLAYVAILEGLGRRHGMRLGLRDKDPILGPGTRALRGLAAMRSPPAADRLRALSDEINGRTYRALDALVREICVLPVTGELVRDVWARVVAEPSFAGAPPAPIVLDGEASGLAVRMFRAELEDVLANLLRNALAAGADRVGVGLARAEDPVTGQEWIELRVRDDAPGALTNAMIRGRHISRGLGLVADVTRRHGGSVRVEPAAGEGTKVVVVSLPGVEAASVEVEWTG